MDDSLESLLDKATNPRNRYEDWEFIMGFCDKVNDDLQGPQVALRLIVPKIKSQDEKVAMLSLAVLEACVKNCGQRFHQELGKFKFLNELIRLISPKYLGNTTSTTVKDRIKELLYSWKVGLPHETKITEAYMMLKREGLVFDESVTPDRTLEPDQVKPKVTLIQDPKQSQMLQKLLASKNPEDLRAANRLIREMVRRDDKRMQKLQKRIEEVELIQNNIKLLNELLAHLNEESGEQERQLVEELYKSIEKMRPKLFRMASELKENEEGMSDILRTNDSVLRVMDLYKSKTSNLPPLGSSEGAKGGGGGDGGAEASANTATKNSPAESKKQSEETASAQNGATGGGGGSGSDILIDLADLNFGSAPIAGGAEGGLDLNSSLGLGSLMDDISALDLGTPTGNNLGMFPPPTSSGMGGAQPPVSGAAAQQPLFPLNPSSGFPPSSQTTFPSLPQQAQAGPAPLLGSAPLISPSSSGSSSSAMPSNFQPLMNTSTSPLITIPPPPQQQAGGSGMGMVKTGPSSSPGMGRGVATGGGANLFGMGSSAPSSWPVQATPTVGVAQQPPSPADPLSVLDSLTVPLEGIKPGSQAPMSVMSKNNVSISFYFAETSPAPGVTVVVISVISTSPTPITNFQFQAAVPKVMRVKLQPPTTMDMLAYNPILPPPSISQVMLLANPSKAKIRMKYKISYKQGGGQEVVELGEASDFPANF